ncbi:MAG TPA: hypothetical protein VM864_13580 [Pyrinomonadaceae bacterium]|jgi:hypothetical protein|nr:hypothetical protein [Pyrinomonadaceae bacterium]
MIRKSLFLFALSLLPLSAAAQQPAATPCTPGVTFASLLGNVKVGYGDGRLGIDSLYAVCLPQPARQSTSNYAYDPDSGGKLTTQVKRADGALLNTYVWYAESIGGLWELSRYKVVGGYESVKPLRAGSYVLEFAADDKVFYRFPFTVAEGKADDPYAPAGARYFIEGAWNDYGNVFYQRNDPASSLSFTTWVQEKSGNDKARQGVPYEIKLVRERDGQTLAVDSATLRLEPHWLKLQSLFKPAGGDANSYYKAGDLLREDGAYSFRFTLDGKPYGRYPFTVKGGRIQLQGNQVREKTDPLSLVVDYNSGGRYTSWWLRREGATR